MENERLNEIRELNPDFEISCQEGRLTEDEVNEIFYYATIGNSMVEHG